MTDQRERIEVSEEELAGILLKIQGAKAIGIVARTKPSCFYKGKNGSRKADAELCPPVVKKAHVSGMTCFAYANARNNDNAREWARQVEALRDEGQEEEAVALEQEGPKQHEPQPRKWGERIQGTPFIRHTKDGETYLYLELMVSNGNNPAWPSGYGEKSYVHPTDPKVQYTLEEAEEGKISLAAWLKPYKPRKNDPFDFNYREYRLDHIEEVRHEGVVYVVKRQAAEAA